MIGMRTYWQNISNQVRLLNVGDNWTNSNILCIKLNAAEVRVDNLLSCIPEAPNLTCRIAKDEVASPHPSGWSPGLQARGSG
jgi:hypothetical protein